MKKQYNDLRIKRGQAGRTDGFAETTCEEINMDPKHPADRLLVEEDAIYWKTSGTWYLNGSVVLEYKDQRGRTIVVNGA